MKTYLIKREKWFHSNFSIYLDNRLIGHFIPEKWKPENWITIEDERYLIKRRSFWKEEKLIYMENNLIGTIRNRVFSFVFIISVIGKSEYVAKLNFWGNRCLILKDGVVAGNYTIKYRNSILNTEIPVENSVIAAVLVQVNSLNSRAQHAAVF